MRNTSGFPLVVCLSLSLTAARVRADDAEAKTVPSAQVKKEGAIFRVPDSYTLEVALTADGKLLARGGADTTVGLWDDASGKKLHTLKGHTVPIMRLAFSADGKTLASVTGTCGLDNDKDPGKLPLGALNLWDVVTAKERATIAVAVYPGFHFFSLALTADGKTLISAMASISESEDKGGFRGGYAVKQWEVATGKERATFWAPLNEGGTNAGVFFTATSADGKTVAWGGAEERDKKITGTASVSNVQSLATTPPKLPKERDEPPPKKPLDEQADDAEDKSALAIAKLGGTVTRDEKAQGKPGKEKEAEKRTIPRPIWLLVDTKTQERIQAGNKGINSFKRPDVPKRLEIPRESAAKTTLRDAKQKKDPNSARFPASSKTLAAYNRDFAVKSVSMTLADNTVIECRALVRMEDVQEVVLDKEIIMALAIETDSDQGPETWYCYVSVYEAAVAPSADLATQKKDMEGLQGTWRITSSQHTDEMFLFEEDARGLKVVAKGDILTYYSRDDRGRYEGRFHLDPVTKAFDWSPAYSGIGPSPGATVPFRGIYELKGDGLIFYFHESKWERPNTFDFKEGWLLVLKRNAKSKAPEDKEKAAEDKAVER